MALLQKTRILPQQRLDLPDYRNLEEFVCADFKAIHKNVWSSQNFVINGFVATGNGTSDLAVELEGSSAIFGENDGIMFIGANGLAPLETSSLTPASTNYIEIIIEQDTGGADSRAFWDQTANAGQGAEFSQIVDTFSFVKASFAINTSNFTSDADKLPICEVDVNASGIITAIRDARNLFFRLGRASDPTFNFSWSTRTEPVNTQFSGADKDINTMKEFNDAVMSAIKEIKGTSYWFNEPNISLTGMFRNTGLSILAGVGSSSRFAWSGTELSITDDSGTPSSTDVIAYLRLLGSTAELELTRQDSADVIGINDDEVLYIQIPKPLADVSYSDVGLTSVNYQVAARGSVPETDDIFWLAYREGSRLYLRGLGELEAGEEQEINDTSSEALAEFLGFNPETATSVPYTATPAPSLFGNIFDNTDDLVTAISANTANINAIGAAIDTNAYFEPLIVVAGVPVDDNEVQFPVVSGDLLTLPNDSRDSDNPEQYVVGDGILKLFLNGQLLEPGFDYNEVGTVGTLSSQVEMLQDLVVDDRLTFRIDSFGGFNVGATSGGDVTGASNEGTGNGEVFKQKAAGILQLRTIRAGAGISVTTIGDEIVISVTGGAAEPFFRADSTGQTTSIISTTANYNLGTNKLGVFRNGVRMIPSNSLGFPVDRYQEATISQVGLDLAATASEVFTFVNLDNTPSGQNLVTGVTGTTLTVPAYTLGSQTLRIYRNGILMNDQGVGGAIDQYTETTTTTVTLGAAAVASDVFQVLVEPAPDFRETLTGVTGTTLTIPNSETYTLGSDRLLVFKNGVLMFNSVSLGTSSDRYQEFSTTQITLEAAATASDVFEFINL